MCFIYKIYIVYETVQLKKRSINLMKSIPSHTNVKILLLNFVHEAGILIPPSLNLKSDVPYKLQNFFMHHSYNSMYKLFRNMSLNVFQTCM